MNIKKTDPNTEPQKDKNIEAAVEMYDARLRELLFKKYDILKIWENALGVNPDIKSLFDSFGPPSNLLKEADRWTKDPNTSSFQDFCLWALLWYTENIIQKIEQTTTDETTTIVNAAKNSQTEITTQIKKQFNTLTKEITNNYNNIIKTNNTNVKTITNFIKDESLEQLLKDINQKLDNIIEDGVKYDPEPILSGIVGESYYKWDNLNMYQPTCVFMFKEHVTVGTPRRSQIKVRLPISPNEFTPEYQSDLRNKVLGYRDLSYTHGTNRYYFVSSDKAFKTTIYLGTKDDGDHVLSTICDMINITFNTNKGSYTERTVRAKINQNNPNITGLPNNPMDYDDEFHVELNRVVVLINGSIQPVVIYQKTNEPSFY